MVSAQTDQHRRIGEEETAKTSRSFGRIGAKINVEFDDRYLTVKGSVGADRARVAVEDVETATIQAGTMGAGPANMRQTYLERGRLRSERQPRSAQ